MARKFIYMGSASLAYKENSTVWMILMLLFLFGMLIAGAVLLFTSPGLPETDPDYKSTLQTRQIIGGVLMGLFVLGGLVIVYIRIRSRSMDLPDFDPTTGMHRRSDPVTGVQYIPRVIEDEFTPNPDRPIL